MAGVHDLHRNLPARTIDPVGERVIVDPEVLAGYCSDVSGGGGRWMPLALVRPTCALEVLEQMREACEADGASSVMASSDEADGAMLINARRLAYPALERLGKVLIEDIAVPLPALPEMFRRIEAIAASASLTVAHAGDGNLHPLIVFDRANVEAELRSKVVFRAIMERALELGGTITGEHGVGTTKVDFLPLQLGREALEIRKGRCPFPCSAGPRSAADWSGSRRFPGRPAAKPKLTPAPTERGLTLGLPSPYIVLFFAQVAALSS